MTNMTRHKRLFSRSKITSLLLVIGMMGIYSQSARAVCSFQTPAKLHVNTLASQPVNITVGPETPDGTILYRQTIRYTFTTNVRCSQSSAHSRYVYVGNIAKAYSWNRQPFANNVYESGIPGVGIVGVHNGNPFSTPGEVRSTFGTVEYNADIILLKIGPVSPGAIAATVISPGMAATDAGGSITYMSYTVLNGTLANIVVPTCTTPNVSVPLGSINPDVEFNTADKASKWVDASIRLINCTTFSGTSTIGPNGDVTTAPNTVSMKMTPNTPIIDSANGIISVRSGSGSASGVGIQIAYGNVGDASPEFINFAAEKSYVMPINGPSAHTLPLIARYIKTGNEVTLGKADATATFTINYM